MIWARPFVSGGDLDPSLLGRAGLTATECEEVAGVLERVALVTGLDSSQREMLAGLVGDAWLGGFGDAAVVRWSASLLKRWSEVDAAEARPLKQAFERLAALEVRLPPFELGPRTFDFSQGPAVMGVVNVTPDSFSDGGRFATVEAAVAHAQLLVAAGADLLDVGGESTRPGAGPVETEVELRRVVPVIEAIAAALPGVPLSVDTSKALVASRAVAAGAHLINDVTGLRDQAMMQTVVALGVPACVMHMRGEPRTMQRDPVYEDVMAEVLDELEQALARGEAAGLPRSRVLVDPGIGFGKSVEHNLFLLRRLGDLKLLGAPVLVGTSRKAFLGAVTGRPVEARAGASAASAAVAVLGGASMVRVHDVPQTRDALAVVRAIATARGGGLRFGVRSVS